MRVRVALSILAVLTASLAAEAQQAGKTYRVAMAFVGPMETVSHLIKAFEHRMIDLGYAPGRNLIVEYRANDGTTGQLRDQAVELVALNPDVIVAWSTVGAVAMKKATSTIPVVFLSVGVPVEIGLVSSLSRPGGNMTGVTFEAATETYAKRLQLLREAAPKTSRIGLLHAVGDPNADHAFQSVDRVAASLRVRGFPVAFQDQAIWRQPLSNLRDSTKKNGTRDPGVIVAHDSSI